MKMNIRFLFLDESSITRTFDDEDILISKVIESLQQDNNKEIQLVYMGATISSSARLSETAVKDGDTITVIVKDRSRPQPIPDKIPPDYLGELDARAMNLLYFVSFVMWSFSFVAYSNHPEQFDFFTVVVMKLFGALWCMSFASTFLRRLIFFV